MVKFIELHVKRINGLDSPPDGLPFLVNLENVDLICPSDDETYTEIHMCNERFNVINYVQETYAEVRLLMKIDGVIV